MYDANISVNIGIYDDYDNIVEEKNTIETSLMIRCHQIMKKSHNL